MATLRLIAEALRALAAWLTIKSKRTTYDLWKESLADEEQIMDRIVDAIQPSNPDLRRAHDAYVDALKRRLHHQQQVTAQLAREIGIARPEVN